MKIRQDHSRFKEIVRGRIKKELRRYMANGELIGRQGQKQVRIPIPRIDIPRFRYGTRDQGGVGQGEGDVGDALGEGDGEEGPGQGKAGEGEGNKELELDVSIEELAEIMAEELELPRIQPRGEQRITSTRAAMRGLRQVGPDALRHMKRSYKEALKRMISTGEYDPDNPVVIPRREDMRYRSWDEQQIPASNAVILYMMDVSGSMGDEQKEIVRIESFWIDTWLRTQYKGIESRYIIHDATAREVDQHTFFHTRESGGTMISSAYRLCLEILEADYPASDWNIYPFHFSDGDNWSVDDTAQCVRLLREQLIPRANMFGYGQVESPYGSGQFLRDLREHFANHEQVVLSEIKNREMIFDSIKTFLGKGM